MMTKNREYLGKVKQMVVPSFAVDEDVIEEDQEEFPRNILEDMVH